MKKLFAILLLTTLSSCGAFLEPPKSNTDYKNIIGKPIKFGNIEVAQYDFPEKMKWDDATKACANLGKGWKLPNKDELGYLYTNRVAIGGLANYSYWSSTNFLNRFAWSHEFSSGNQHFGIKASDTFYVRAIRSF